MQALVFRRWIYWMYAYEELNFCSFIADSRAITGLR
jgi:hypothetical protein